jgi:hypothetical protein
MLHWRLLIKTVLQENKVNRYQKQNLIAENEDKFHSIVSSEIKRKWFRIGLLELLPASLGIILMELVPFILFEYDYIIAGVILSVILIAFFNNKSLNPPIQLQDQTFTLNH